MEKKSNVFAAIRYRRSVREYSTKPVEKWKLDLILESARLAPSSTNSQPWRIIVVTDEDSKNLLADATPGRIKRHKWLPNCPVVLIICGVKTVLQRAAKIFKKDYSWVDIGITGEHICLVAVELGLGTCWLGWILKDRIRKEFNIPNTWDVICLITLGYPAGDNGRELNKNELTMGFGSAEPFQQKGELGIGNIEAKRRYSTEKIIFYDKVIDKKKKGISLY